MKIGTISQLFALAAAAAISTSSAAFAVVDAKYDSAVSTYLHEDYKNALQQFQALSKTEPSNLEVHHYLALCYQRLNDDQHAASEYELVMAHSNNAASKEIIQERLNRTKLRLTHGKSKEEAVPAPAKQHDPLKKVILFSTNWCPVCKKFAPTWDSTKAKFKNVSFVHLNAEDPANAKIVELYRPKAYPTLVFLDGKDKVIQNYADAPGAVEFAKELTAFGSGK